MDISALIRKLEEIKAQHGDLEVVTDDYNGGDSVLNMAEPIVYTNDPRAMRPIVIMTGRGRY